MVDLKKLLEEVREEREIAEREARLSRQSPHISQTFKVGSPGWEKAKRKQMREEKKLEDREITKAINRSLAQAKYHRKNKERLNMRRVKALRLPKPTYKRAKARAERRGQVWEMTFEEWWNKWSSAEWVWDPKKGCEVPAWKMRGGNYQEHVQLVRIDTEGPWSVGNTELHIPAKLTVHPDKTTVRRKVGK